MKWLLIGLAIAVSSAQASEVRVAVASNFSAPMQDLVAEFERQSQGKVKVAYCHDPEGVLLEIVEMTNYEQ